MLLIMGFVVSAAYYFLIVHIIAFTTDVIAGLSAQKATLILITMSLASIAGKMSVAYLTTRMGNRRTLFVVLAFQMAAMFAFAKADSLALLFAVAAVFGYGFGATSPIRTSLIPELFGLSSVATLIGVVNVAWALGGTAGPFMAGYIFDVTRSYEVAFTVGGVLLAIGLAAAFFVKEPKPR
jgi:predicted MFS family arabinose efflux permease